MKLHFMFVCFKYLQCFILSGIGFIHYFSFSMKNNSKNQYLSIKNFKFFHLFPMLTSRLNNDVNKGLSNEKITTEKNENRKFICIIELKT